MHLMNLIILSVQKNLVCNSFTYLGRAFFETKMNQNWDNKWVKSW